MSNVYIGNSIVSHHSGWEYRVFPMLKVPLPLRVHYINERVGSMAFFVSLTFSNASQSVSRLLRILIETLLKFVVEIK